MENPILKKSNQNSKWVILCVSIKQNAHLIKVIYQTGQILAVVKTQTPITYKIKDLEGEVVKGTFYSHELQRVEKEQIYEIDSVLDHRKRKIGKKWVKEIKVHWKGYPSKFDSWILESDLVKKHENGSQRIICTW